MRSLVLKTTIIARCQIAKTATQVFTRIKGRRGLGDLVRKLGPGQRCAIGQTRSETYGLP